MTGVKVTGFKKDNSGAVKTVLTDTGNIDCEVVIIGTGPWVQQLWDMLDLPAVITIKGRGDKLYENVPVRSFWSLQEGTLGVDPELQHQRWKNAPGDPRGHGCDALFRRQSFRDHGSLWGIYYKPDFNFGGAQGGAMPFKVLADAASVKIDPYGPKSPDFVVGEDFARMWCSALAFCQNRFEGTSTKFKREPSGGIGSFTADSFLVFDRFCDNVYVIADSIHGYKMIGFGQLVAEEILGCRHELLKSFRFSRFARSQLHRVSRSPFPGS